MSGSDPGPSSNASSFATTQWSVVHRAGRTDSPDARLALESLCGAYWYPLYAYVRRRGYQPAEAQDLTQAFFAELVEKDRLRLADQQRGRFRSFLLASFRHFISNCRRAAHAQKRRGDALVVPVQFDEAESRYCNEPCTDLTPERIYERKWVLTLLERTLNRLRAQYEAAGRAGDFDQLKDYLSGDRDLPPYAELAERLQMTEGAVKVAIHRLRKQYGQVLRAAIAETLSDPSEVDDELKTLFTSLRE